MFVGLRLCKVVILKHESLGSVLEVIVIVI